MQTDSFYIIHVCFCVQSFRKCYTEATVIESLFYYPHHLRICDAACIKMYSEVYILRENRYRDGAKTKTRKRNVNTIEARERERDRERVFERERRDGVGVSFVSNSSKKKSSCVNIILWHIQSVLY